MSLFLEFKSMVMQKSRSEKLEHFYACCSVESPVLDVGVSNNEYSPQTNKFLKEFRFDSKFYTGLAVQSLDKIIPKYPGKRFVEYTGGVFPFKDKQFEWVFSNAVIEHVGNNDDQLQFINEMLRKGNHVFFTTPNKYFPIESHTNAFIIHWFSNYFYDWCKKVKPYWSRTNLLLLSYHDLNFLMQKSNAKEYRISKNYLLGWPMTFTVICFSQ